MLQKINSKQILDTWMPIVEEATGLSYSNPNQRDKINWISEYAHNHTMYNQSVNEANFNTVTNTPGMGAVKFPGNPGTQYDFWNQTRGSGDTPDVKLSIAMQVAAQTVGLDLVPVVTMDAPVTLLTYADSIYANGILDDVQNGLDNPEMVKFPVDAISEASLLNDNALIGTVLTITTTISPSENYVLTGNYIGRSRLDGYPIVKVKNIVHTTAGVVNPKPMIKDVIVNGAAYTINGVAVTGSVTGRADYVKALEDHITGYSGRFFQTMDRKDLNQPYLREEGERTPTRSLGLKFSNKSVEAQTYQVDIAVTREQLQDSKHLGLDLIARAHELLANETTQSINKNIIDRIFALGATNAMQIYRRHGVHFNVNFDDTTGSAKVFDLGYGSDGVNAVMTVPAAQATSAKVGAGGETLLTAQRRIVDQVLSAGNMITVRGRRGGATSAIVNGQLATVLQLISGFQAAPVMNTFSQTNGSLTPLGSLAGVTFYTDPNMDWSDTRVVVFRKGEGVTPGVIFMPYILTDTVETVAESLMGPKIQVKSRYALVDAGQHPQLYYITFKVNTIGGSLMR